MVLEKEAKIEVEWAGDAVNGTFALTFRNEAEHATIEMDKDLFETLMLDLMIPQYVEFRKHVKYRSQVNRKSS